MSTLYRDGALTDARSDQLAAEMVHGDALSDPAARWRIWRVA